MDLFADSYQASLAAAQVDDQQIFVVTEFERGTRMVNPVVSAVASPPVAAVRLSPLSPATGDTLTATVGATDANGDAVTLTYVWTVDDVEVRRVTDTPATSDTLDLSVAGNGDRGQVVRVTVTPTAADEAGAPAHAEVTVANSVPVVATSTSVETDEDTPAPFDLSATDADGDELTVVVTDAPTQGTLACSGVSCTYTPDAETSGGDAATVTVTDGASDPGHCGDLDHGGAGERRADGDVGCGVDG